LQGHEVGALDVWIGRRLGGDLGIVFWTERGLNWKREIRLEVEPSHGQRCGWRRVRCAGKLEEEGGEEREGRVNKRQTDPHGQRQRQRQRTDPSGQASPKRQHGADTTWVPALDSADWKSPPFSPCQKQREKPQ